MTPEDAGAEEPDSARQDAITKGTRIAQTHRIAESTCVVYVEDDIRTVAEALSQQRQVHTAAVVDADGTLVGVIPLRVLLDELFLQVAPEEFLAEISDREHTEEYARMVRARSARDLMQDPVYVTVDDTVGDAFSRMHDHDLDGLPVVDEGLHPSGYLDRLELMKVWLREHDADEHGGSA